MDTLLNMSWACYKEEESPGSFNIICKPGNYYAKEVREEGGIPLDGTHV